MAHTSPAASNVPALAMESSVPEPIATVMLHLPSFWTKNPRVWFLQIEAQFQLRRISSQSSRYLHVVSCLPSEIADELSDVLARPPEENPYDHLKETILNRKTETERSRLQQLLTAEELGDRRPSQLLRRMRQLLGDCSAEEANSSLLREMFLQRLPQNLLMVLAAADDMSLDRLAELADRVAAYTTPSLGHIAATSSGHDTPASTSRLEERLGRIETALAALSISPATQPRRRPRSRSRSRTSSPGSARATSTHCWYHRTFGSAARKCCQPCTWTGNDVTSH